ncbi:threonylcarbamoyl-AMP synthase [Candidatus Peregrinibacteria bacterium]|nr:threonylcarbamoyl-AMP synthase [Candidatus Peregrinibacteria bacterium]
MKIIPYNKKTLAEAVKVLKKGGVIAHPADTCYGLAGDLGNVKALKCLQTIKGRDRLKPMSVMFPSFMKLKLKDYVKLDDFSSFVIEQLLPGPVTLVLPKNGKIPFYFFPDNPTIGIRIPYDEMTQNILLAFGGPLITTSANLSSEPACCACTDVKRVFKGAPCWPDVIFEGAVKNHCMPSTVISVENKKVKILREGPMTKKQVEEILGVKVK